MHYQPPAHYQAPDYQQYYPPVQYGPVSMGPQGQGFGWGPGVGSRPPKRSKAPLFVLLGLMALGVVGLGLLFASQGSSDVTTPVVPSQSTAPSPTTEPTEPSQSTDPADIAATSANKLYSTGKQATVSCKEPAVRPTTTQNAAAYWAAVKPCLDKAWAPHVRSAGYRFRAPSMTYWSGTVMTSPCGNGRVPVPFYCPANEMMYMKVDVFAKTYNEYPEAEAKARARMWYSRSIAHEYGHHVQNMVGILPALSRMRYQATSVQQERLLTRRNELQANCFAGVFLAANKSSYPINGMMLFVWNKWVVTAGDPPGQGTHGSPQSQQRFMGRSFTTADPATCNTYTAPADEVN